MYWNGSAWVTLNPGIDGQVLSICNGSLTWVTMAGLLCPPPPAALTTINCGGATTTGTLTTGTAASGVSTAVSYTGGNAGTYGAQSVSSTGVVGLTASLAAGTLANGAGSLTYTITGTPTTNGTASFAISLGGQSCTFTINVGVQGFTIGAGTSTTNWPTENFGGANRCNRSATIYPKAVLNQAGGFPTLGNQLLPLSGGHPLRACPMVTSKFILKIPLQRPLPLVKIGPPQLLIIRYLFIMGQFLSIRSWVLGME
jgi:hypothetical protein